ncbi:TPA: hypothetical protein ACIN9P_001950 [Streptococcus agalactiae]
MMTKTKEFKIRNIPDEVYTQLKMIADKYQYASFNQFMIDQMQAIVINDGLSLYHNKFVDSLIEIKQLQKEILDQQLKNEIQTVAMDAKLDLVRELTLGWLQFMDDVDALSAERAAGGDE